MDFFGKMWMLSVVRMPFFFWQFLSSHLRVFVLMLSNWAQTSRRGGTEERG